MIKCSFYNEKGSPLRDYLQYIHCHIVDKCLQPRPVDNDMPSSSIFKFLLFLTVKSNLP